jgi:hypothetical protein
MTPEAYQQALRDRGFTYHASCDKWVGPYNIQATGFLDGDTEERGPERTVGNIYARAAEIMRIDEQLRARRGIPRGPLVEPQEPYDPTYQPYVNIPDPGAYPQAPLYPRHQTNLPPGARRSVD